MKTIELVVPVFNERENLPRFFEEIARVFETRLPGYAWKVIAIDDGSRDDSWSYLRELSKKDPRVRAVRLNRNYGSHIAISAGMSASVGDSVVVIAADLQDPPSTIPEFVAQWEAGNRVVWAVRAVRREAFHRKLYSRIFHSLVRRYALPGYPSSGTGSFCLVDREVARNVKRMREGFRTIFGLIAIQGYKSAEIPYTRLEREHGRSGWTFHRMLRTTVDVFTSYSHLPVRLIQGIGIFSCLAAALGVGYQLWRYVAFHDTLRGWTLLFASVCFFGGVQTLALGILGEYIWRTFHESKRRPLWYVDEATFAIASETGDQRA